MGPTSGSLYQRFTPFKAGNSKSNFAKHLFKKSFNGPNRRCYDCLRRPMNTSENFHIYPKIRDNNKINYKITVSGKVLFDTIIAKDLFQ